MRKVLVPAAIALAVCASALYVAYDAGRSPAGSARSTGDVPAMSAAEAASHRDDRYAAIDSVEQVLALPSHFARMEAIYALAGRSDSAAVQNLVFQASGIPDPSDRKDVLHVLFARLTELDAPSALALSVTADFRRDPDFQREVWQRWGELDLDTAVATARGLDSKSRRNLAAQSLFAAYDYWGNETTSRIAELLDAQPDERTRALYVHRLADRDPSAAIEYAESLESMAERREAATLLARRFGRDSLPGAGHYAAEFEDAGLRGLYENALAQSAAKIDPERALEAVLADDGSDGVSLARAMAAFQVLAADDIDRALGWLERIEHRTQWEMLAGIAAQALAEQDPERALAWARESDRGQHRRLYMQVLATIARTHPERAFSEASALPGFHERRRMYSMIATSLAQRDPMEALSFIDRIEGSSERKEAASTVVNVWMRSAPEAAVSWILRQDAAAREELLTDVGRWLPTQDPEMAMRLLPQLGEPAASAWRTMIAASLAATRSIEEAQRFIASFEGSDDYPRLLSSVIQGLAVRDVRAAVELTGRLPDGNQRDVMYSALIGRFADQDPAQAALLLDAIVDPEQRTNAASQLVTVWGRIDAEAAERWTRSLPRGSERDTAITALASTWNELDPSRRRLIDEIDDPLKRKQIAFGFVFRTARSDPEEAERILESFDLPEADAEEILQHLENMRTRQSGLYPGF